MSNIFSLVVKLFQANEKFSEQIQTCQMESNGVEWVHRPHIQQ